MLDRGAKSPATAARMARVWCGLVLIGFAAWPARGQRADSALATLAYSTESYLSLLASLDENGVRRDSTRVLRHLSQLALVLPDDIERQVAEGDLLNAPQDAKIRAGAGVLLVNWWRRQDPLPASPVNERLLEHMQRIQYAESQFTSSERPTGFDDRGEVYVLYGRPERELTIRFDEPEFTDKIYKFGMVINQSDFPANVFWRYGHISGSGHFLFLEQDGQFRIAGATDLLPRPLRTGFTQEKRGQRRAEMALATMWTIYRQLAAEDPVFLNRFSEVDNYISSHEEPGRVAARLLGDSFRRAVLDQDDDTDLQPGGAELPASEVVQSSITSSKVEDTQLAYQREVLMPPTYTEVYRALPLLPIALRAARFLDSDGTTRTELYWGPEPGAMRRQDQGENFVLHMTSIKYGPSYNRRNVTTRSIQVADLPRGRDAVIPAQQTTVRGGTGLYHVALQWDLHRLIRNREDQLSTGQRLRVGVLHVDSLTALNASGEVLEMSDLKPVFIWSAVELIGDSEPYPYKQVGTDVPLGMYFEIYHLRYDEEDYTRYSVTYQIARRAEGGRADRQRRAPTSVTTVHTGTQSNGHQEVLLDLTDWENAGLVEVRVTLRDLTARRSVTRSIEFELL